MEVTAKPRRVRKGRYERRSKEEIRPFRITERSERILFLLDEYRFLRTDQIEDILFFSKERYSRQHTNRHLSALHDIHYVEKPRAQRTMWRETGSGSPRDIFALGNPGAGYLEERFRIPRTRFADKNRTVKHPQIEHALLTADIMLAFERAAGLRDDVRLISSREILLSAPEKTRAAQKPFAWRVDVQWEGEKMSVPVTPDKVFGLEFLNVPWPNRLYFMLEADTGEEPVMPENPKVVKSALFHKYLGYHASFRAKLHTERLRISAFRVITVTERNGIQVSREPKTGERIEKTRIQNLQEAARLSSGGETPLFLFADLPSLKRHDDVLTMPWVTTHRSRTATLEPKR